MVHDGGIYRSSITTRGAFDASYLEFGSFGLSLKTQDNWWPLRWWV